MCVWTFARARGGCGGGRSFNTLTWLVYLPTTKQNGYIGLTTRAYFYNGQGSVPGPTLRVKPGDVLSITLVNRLEGDNSPLDDPALASNNTFHSASVHPSPALEAPHICINYPRHL